MTDNFVYHPVPRGAKDWKPAGNGYPDYRDAGAAMFHNRRGDYDAIAACAIGWNGHVELDHVLTTAEMADAAEAWLCRPAQQVLDRDSAVCQIMAAYHLHDAPDTHPGRVRGWKALMPDCTSRYWNMRYEPGMEYSMDGIVALCNRGYHFCPVLLHVFNYYPTETARVFEVEAWGRVVHGDDGKSVATRIKLVRELSMREVFHLVDEQPESVVGVSKRTVLNALARYRAKELAQEATP